MNLLVMFSILSALSDGPCCFILCQKTILGKEVNKSHPWWPGLEGRLLSISKQVFTISVCWAGHCLRHIGIEFVKLECCLSQDFIQGGRLRNLMKTHNWRQHLFRQVSISIEDGTAVEVQKSNFNIMAKLLLALQMVPPAIVQPTQESKSVRCQVWALQEILTILCRFCRDNVWSLGESPASLLAGQAAQRRVEQL